MPSKYLILCHPLPLLPSIFPSIGVFSNESVLRIRWPKYWSFSFSISPSNEHSGLISFRIDWLDLLAVQGTLKSPLQHHSSKASILLRSTFFIVQLSYPYITTGKTIALTRWTFVGKVVSLLFFWGGVDKTAEFNLQTWLTWMRSCQYKRLWLGQRQSRARLPGCTSSSGPGRSPAAGSAAGCRPPSCWEPCWAWPPWWRGDWRKEADF